MQLSLIQLGLLVQPQLPVQCPAYALHLQTIMLLKQSMHAVQSTRNIVPHTFSIIWYTTS